MSGLAPKGQEAIRAWLGELRGPARAPRPRATDFMNWAKAMAAQDTDLAFAKTGIYSSLMFAQGPSNGHRCSCGHQHQLGHVHQSTVGNIFGL